MYGQFFGSYLLNKHVVTPQQLISAISDIKKSHIKLGTLAMYKGYMTSDEVDECCFLQRREDKRFGEIAIERSYLFQDQLEDLLESQIPEYLRLGQTLVDAGVLTNGQLHDLMVGYSSENVSDETEELDAELRSIKSHSLVSNFFKEFGKDIDEYTLTYVNLIFNNLVRFIGDDFTPLEPVFATEYQTIDCITQGIKCDGEVKYSRIDMEENTSITFASRYAEMEFDEYNEYVSASVEDFLNLHNGLYCVNLSNIYSKELTLTASEHIQDEELVFEQETMILPVIFPFGTIYIILSTHIAGEVAPPKEQLSDE